MAVQDLTIMHISANEDLGPLKKHEFEYVLPGPQAQWPTPGYMLVRSSSTFPNQTGGGSRPDTDHTGHVGPKETTH